MSLLDFLRIVSRNWYWLLLSALALAVLTWTSLKKQAPQYSSHSIINTGLVSNYTIESNEGASIDYAFTNNELQNIINVATSYQTMEELGLRLLAKVLDKRTKKGMLLPENRQDLDEKLGAKVLAQLRTKNPALLQVSLMHMRDRSRHSKVYELLYSDHPLFGIEQLQTITVERYGNSDMLKISYQTSDPGICQLTLKLLAEIIMETQLSLKKGQSGDVLAFFDEATRKSAAELRAAEDELLGFKVRNKVINYYEQTRFISGKKEDFDELYYKEMMNLASADSTIQKLEGQLRQRVNLPRLNQSIMDQRKTLTELSTKISTMEIMPDSLEDFSSNDLRKLKRQAEKVRENIRNTVDETWMNTNMPEGLPVRDVLNQWLSSVLKQEESTARMQVIRQRQAEFVHIYDQYAPWGSTIRRMERQIDVNERAYLENLHSFNQARLHQINMMMSSNLKVIDEPVFPKKPEPSKKMMFVVMAFLAGLFIPLGLFIAMFLLDQSLNSVVRAEEKTGLKLASALPFVDKFKIGPKARVDFQAINDKAMQQFIHTLKMSNQGQQSPIVAFLSNRSGEGKSWLITRLAAYLEQKGQKVHLIKASDWVTKRAQVQRGLQEQPAWVLVEFPALLEQSEHLPYLNEMHSSVYIAYARKVWSKADERALNRIKDCADKPAHLFLNALDLDHMEDVIGEVPKRRNMPRRWLKRMVTLQYS